MGASGAVGEGRGAGCGGGSWFPLLLLFLTFVISLLCNISSWDTPGRRAKGSSQRTAFARTEPGSVYHAMIYLGRTRVIKTNKTKKMQGNFDQAVGARSSTPSNADSLNRL